MTDPSLRTTADVARLLGVKPATIRHYRADSLPGGRYESHPFPAPDGKLGAAPYWLPGRDEEIRKWATDRPGQGSGGGRPTRQRADEASD